MPPLDPFDDLSDACYALSETCSGLKHAVSVIDAPHVRRRPGGFHGMFRIIVEQQVSVPSAQAILRRVTAEIDMNDPHAALSAGVDGLRALGLSTPKAKYVAGLADQLVAGGFSFEALNEMRDDAALQHLIAIKGVGPWSAAIYLLFCDGRIDIWPPKDVALLAAYRQARLESGRPDHDIKQLEIDEAAMRWAPYRGVAAHILWTYYARLKGRTPI